MQYKLLTNITKQYYILKCCIQYWIIDIIRQQDYRLRRQITGGSGWMDG